MENIEYINLYNDFIKSYASGTTTGGQAGELVMRLASFYPAYNQSLVNAERAFALLSKDEISKSDDMTGKAVSASKSEIISLASDESFAYKKAKMHIQNIEILIQSIKALQRGLMQEMSNSTL